MDKLSDQDMILFITKLAPYGWGEIPEPDNTNKSPDRFLTDEESAALAKKNATPKKTAKDSPKKLTDKDHETIKSALRIMVNTLCKRIDRLSDKHLILFSALLARYRYIPDLENDENEIRHVTMGVAA